MAKGLMRTEGSALFRSERMGPDPSPTASWYPPLEEEDEEEEDEEEEEEEGDGLGLAPRTACLGLGSLAAASLLDWLMLRRWKVELRSWVRDEVLAVLAVLTLRLASLAGVAAPPPAPPCMEIKAAKGWLAHRPASTAAPSPPAPARPPPETPRLEPLGTLLLRPMSGAVLSWKRAGAALAAWAEREWEREWSRL